MPLRPAASRLSGGRWAPPRTPDFSERKHWHHLTPGNIPRPPHRQEDWILSLDYVSPEHRTTGITKTTIKLIHPGVNRGCCGTCGGIGALERPIHAVKPATNKIWQTVVVVASGAPERSEESCRRLRLTPVTVGRGNAGWFLRATGDEGAALRARASRGGIVNPPDLSRCYRVTAGRDSTNQQKTPAVRPTGACCAGRCWGSGGPAQQYS